MTIPRELSEAATVYQLGPWRRFTRLELPFGAISLIANSMMSWAGGWFVLTASEQFAVGAKDFRLPGSARTCRPPPRTGDLLRHVPWARRRSIAVIVLLDQLLWRPLVVWSDRFKFEQSGAAKQPTLR